MINCPKCKTENPDNTVKCQGCGENLKQLIQQYTRDSEHAGVRSQPTKRGRLTQFFNAMLWSELSPRERR